MTLTRFVGDIHGCANDMRAFNLHGWEGPSVQIGDYGIGFGQSQYWHDAVESMSSMGHRFIRGNHDNPERCRQMRNWIPDGRVENDVMYIGGAWSIDWNIRTYGIDWWPDEECSYVQFRHMTDTYATVKPRVMVTHDAPLSVSDQMFIKAGLAMGGKNATSIETRTGVCLQQMLEIHQPDLWIFGHWHATKMEKIGNTEFHCIGILDHKDFDI